MGERLKASRRVSEPGDLLQPEGSANRHPAIAQSKPTLIDRISAAGAANIHRQAAKPRSACTHPVVSIRLVQNIRQVNHVGTSQKYWQYARECARWVRETKQEDDRDLFERMPWLMTTLLGRRISSRRGLPNEKAPAV